MCKYSASKAELVHHQDGSTQAMARLQALKRQFDAEVADLEEMYGDASFPSRIASR